ncbi:hypothetical protein M959_11935, partial [Chaetura pelagica]
SPCLPPCKVTCTQPRVYSRNLKPCVVSCEDSTALVCAPLVVVTFPGPILSSCPQNSYMGLSFPEPGGALSPCSSGNSYGM